MKSIKVVFISDTHNQHYKVHVPDGDILIHSGDATNRGTYSEVKDFNEWLGTLPHKHKIFVPGNHDNIFEQNPGAAEDLMTNAVVLVDKFIVVDGLKIYGSPWTPKFYHWSFQRRDVELFDRWAMIPERLDLLITHGPPHGILDLNEQMYPCGSQTLLSAVLFKKPRYHAFGHIHESSGVFLKHGITFINSAVVNDLINGEFEPIVEIIEIEDGL